MVAETGDASAMIADRVAFQLALPATGGALFRADSHDLVAVSAIGDVDASVHVGNPEYRLFYAASERTAAPVAAQISAGGRAALRSTQSGIITDINKETGVIGETSCHCALQHRFSKLT